MCMRSFFFLICSRTGFLTQQQPRLASSVVQIKEIRKWSDGAHETAAAAAAFSMCEHRPTEFYIYKMNSIHTLLSAKSYERERRCCCPSLSDLYRVSCGACDFQQSAKNGLDCGCVRAQFFPPCLPFSKPEVRALWSAD